MEEVAFTPNGFPRLFNTAHSLDNTGYGTPGLAGDLGIVLIVQQSGGRIQWKANELGGIISFEFETPVSQVIELGLMNVVEEVWVQVTDADNAARTFVVWLDGPNSTKYILLDVAIVSWVDVVAQFSPGWFPELGSQFATKFQPSLGPSETPSGSPCTLPSLAPSSAPSVRPDTAPSGTLSCVVFRTPVGEMIELGCLNIVEEVWMSGSRLQMLTAPREHLSCHR